MNEQIISSLECQEIKNLSNCRCCNGKLHLSYSEQRYSPSHLFINSCGLNPIAILDFPHVKQLKRKKRNNQLELNRNFEMDSPPA